MQHWVPDRRSFTFRVGSAEGFRVYAFTGTEEVHKPYEFEIELVHESPNVDFAEVLGKSACLSITDKSGGVRHVHGVVRKITQLHTAHARTHYRVVLVPRLWFLGLVTDHRIFQDMSVPRIIERVLKDQNFTGDSFAFKCFFDYAPREYCVQYRETALHFISRLCEEEGLYFYFEHSENRHVLCFSDREGGPRIGGESLLRFHPGAGTEVDTATVQAIDLRQGIVSDSVSLREWNFQKTRLKLDAGQIQPDPVKAPIPVGMTLEQYHYPHLYQLKKEGDRFAGIELLRHFSLSRRVEGTADVCRLVPGHTFELHQHPRPELNAKWWAVRVTHRGEQPQVLEHEAPDRGMTYESGFLAIPETTRFVPAADHPKNRVIGEQSAIVTGPEGEEIYPDQYGRVKVQFHWDRFGTLNERTICWIRVSQGWAGGQYGTMAIPRVGHEVIVSCQEGDPDRPLITGRIYNAANPVPYPLPENKTRTVFKSMSTPGTEGERRGFNELRIEDKKGQEEIHLHAEKDVNAYVKNDWKEHILHDQHRTIDNCSYSLVKGEDQQIVEKDRKIELLSDDYLTVRGSSHSSIGDKWLLHAGNESHVAAGRKTVIEACTELTIKAGAGFIKIDPSGVYIGGIKIKVNSGGSPGTGSGARPLLPKDSQFVDKGTVPEGSDTLAHSGLVSSASSALPQDRENWIELEYLYKDGSGVAGAGYRVVDNSTGAEVASGVLDNNGFARTALPESVLNVSYDFDADPPTLEYLKQPVPNPEQEKIVQGWSQRMGQGIASAGVWTWGLIQGDFSEDQTVGQIAVNTVITMIPGIDQLGDLRDIAANLKMLIWDKRYNDKWVWIALVLTLIGCIPVIGSAAKGVLKVVARHLKAGTKVPLKLLVEVLNAFHKGNAITWLRRLVRELPDHAVTIKGMFRNILAGLRNRLLYLLNLLPSSLRLKCIDAVNSLDEVARVADDKIDEAVEELQGGLGKSLDEGVDFEQTGTTRSKNTRQQTDTDAPSTPKPEPTKVKPSGEGRLSGKPEKISVNDEAPTIRAKTRQNESAVTLSDNGYNVVQQPATKSNGRRPDYLIEGEFFDCYAPGKNTPPRNITSALQRKINDGQAERFIINLNDWNGNIADLQKQIVDYPLEGLQQILIDKSGSIIELF